MTKKGLRAVALAMVMSLCMVGCGETETNNNTTNNEPEKAKNKAVSSLVHFTHKEIKNMSTTFKKVFIANGLAAHVLKKPSGKNTFRYEIRYRANGYCIIASSTDLRKAKEKFLAKTSPDEIEKYRVDKLKTKKDTFEHIFRKIK